MKLAALVMTGGTALALTAAPAMAGVTGPETAHGAVYGKAAAAENPVIPVTWQGLVNAHGVFSPNGPAPKKGQHHTFDTSAGKLVVVVTAPPANYGSVNIKACHFSDSTYVDFAAVGSRSTGKFAGLSGPGAVKVYFAGYGPRYTSGKKKGQCNMNAPELAKGAVASFVLSAVLTK
ncbi:MAG: hypothetical protein WAK82_04595 [Streptosporangiaceae bacterium]